MRKILLTLLFPVSVFAQDPKVLEVLDQEDQLVLIKTTDKYQDVQIKVEEESCEASVRETVGNHSVVKVKTKSKAISPETPEKTVKKCVLNNKVQPSEISLTPYLETPHNRMRFYIGAGLSFGPKAETTSNITANNIQFNYALALYKQNQDLLMGGIYQVYSNRLYGNIDGSTPSSKLSYESQVNNFLLGFSMRKLFGNLDASNFYLRGDVGYHWYTIGTSVLASPTDKSLDSGIGANLGLGFMINTGSGAVDLGFSYSLRSSDKVEQGNFSNLTLGYCF